MRLLDFKEGGVPNDVVIQMALRETDPGPLAEAMVSLSAEEREIILRNMSKRAAGLIIKDTADAEKRVSEHTSKAALDFFLQKLSRFRRYLKERPYQRSEESEELPTLDFATPGAIVESFVALSHIAAARGWLSLQGAESAESDPVVRKGLELAIDGWDPLLARTILERTAETTVRSVERRYKMIVEGFDSLLSGDGKAATEQRLRAYLE